MRVHQATSLFREQDRIYGSARQLVPCALLQDAKCVRKYFSIFFLRSVRNAFDREHISIKPKGEMVLEITQLNSKAAAYYANRCDQTFREMYDEAVKVFQKTHRAQTLAMRRGDEHDADSYFNDAFLRLSQRDDIDDFARTFSKALRIGRLKIGRDNGRRQRLITVTLDATIEQEDGSYTPIYETPTVESAEVTYARSKKEADQLQLIDFLENDPGQVDRDTTLILSQFRQYDSITALAKALGMHHEFVKRKLRKLSRRYDANRFGDVRDYLAV